MEMMRLKLNRPGEKAGIKCLLASFVYDVQRPMMLRQRGYFDTDPALVYESGVPSHSVKVGLIGDEHLAMWLLEARGERLEFEMVGGNEFLMEAMRGKWDAYLVSITQTPVAALTVEISLFPKATP